MDNQILYFICPICGNEQDWPLDMIGADFPVLQELHVIGAGRRAAKCPKCESTDRERLVYIHVVEILEKMAQNKISILHFAPEKHIASLLINDKRVKYRAVDLFVQEFDYPEFVIKGDVCSIPYIDETFDFVICNHVLSDVDDDLKAMEEIMRVLKYRGNAIIQVPISKSLIKTYIEPAAKTPQAKEWYYGNRYHVRIYGPDYKNRLESIGFSVEKLNLFQKYPYYGLNPEENLFICHK